MPTRQPAKPESVNTCRIGVAAYVAQGILCAVTVLPGSGWHPDGHQHSEGVVDDEPLAAVDLLPLSSPRVSQCTVVRLALTDWESVIGYGRGLPVVGQADLFPQFREDPLGHTRPVQASEVRVHGTQGGKSVGRYPPRATQACGSRCSP